MAQLTVEPKSRTTIDSMSEAGYILVTTETYIVIGEQEVVLSTVKEALNPSESDRAKEILPPNLFEAIESLWTPDVIERWYKIHPQSV